MRVEAKTGALVEPILCPGISMQGRWFTRALYLKTFPFHGRRTRSVALYGPWRGEGKGKDFFHPPTLPTQESLSRRYWKCWYALLLLLKARAHSPGAACPPQTKHSYRCHQFDPYSKGTGQLSVYSRQHPKLHFAQEVLSKVNDSVEEEWGPAKSGKLSQAWQSFRREVN